MIGRLLTTTEAILAGITQDDTKLAALLDKDFPPPVLCTHCGLVVKDACDPTERCWRRWTDTPPWE